MSPCSARAAAARGGGSPALPAERGPGRLPGAGREGGDARGREERDTREAAITHSLTHSQPRASSLPAPPSPPATSRREEPPALGATPPAGPPGRGGDPRAPQPRSPHRPECRAGEGDNLVFDGGHGKGGRGAAPRRGEGDGKGELHHGPRGALPSPSAPRPPPALAAELGPGGRSPRPREGKMERGRGGGTRGRGAALLTPPQPPRLAGRRRVRSALPPLRARRGAAAAAAAANRRQPPPLPQLAPVPLPASKWRQLVSGCSNGTAEGSERGQRGAAAPPAGPRGSTHGPRPGPRGAEGGPGPAPAGARPVRD
ncbi:basic salivary proline-rich protein 3-like [Chamaea fasciata]|uniref:basic salivary proline-rich protein 3-like n=1 Tax=Chamaea fasciata TaxID=190680 RepID=UPI00336A5770